MKNKYLIIIGAIIIIAIVVAIFFFNKNKNENKFSIFMRHLFPMKHWDGERCPWRSS